MGSLDHFSVDYVPLLKYSNISFVRNARFEGSFDGKPLLGKRKSHWKDFPLQI